MPQLFVFGVDQLKMRMNLLIYSLFCACVNAATNATCAPRRSVRALSDAEMLMAEPGSRIEGRGDKNGKTISQGPGSTGVDAGARSTSTNADTGRHSSEDIEFQQEIYPEQKQKADMFPAQSNTTDQMSNEGLPFPSQARILSHVATSQKAKPVKGTTRTSVTALLPEFVGGEFEARFLDQTFPKLPGMSWLRPSAQQLRAVLHKHSTQPASSKTGRAVALVKQQVDSLEAGNGGIRGHLAHWKAPVAVPGASHDDDLVGLSQTRRSLYLSSDLNMALEDTRANVLYQPGFGCNHTLETGGGGSRRQAATRIELTEPAGKIIYSSGYQELEDRLCSSGLACAFTHASRCFRSRDQVCLLYHSISNGWLQFYVII
jgi:hypothetical protein